MKIKIKKSWLGYALLLGVVVIALIAQTNHKTNQMEAYAKTNNCTWYATGTMYGDDRDFICK